MGFEIICCTNCKHILPWCEEYKNECPHCKSKQPNIELAITVKEWGKIQKVSKDIDFLLAMDELKKKDIIEFNLKLSQMNTTTPQPQQSSSPQPKCPTCGSSNIKKISATKRWVGTGLFGLASSDIGKTMQCEDCGYKW